MDAEMIACESADADAQSRCTDARDAVMQKKVHLAAQTVALRDATMKVDEALSLQERGDKVINDASSQQQKLKDAEKNILLPLKEGQLTGAKARKQANALAAMGRQYGFDDSLTSVLADALTRKTDSKTSFDDFCVRAFETQLTTKVAELEKLIAEETPAQEKRASAVATAKSAQDDVKALHKARADEVKKAVAVVKECQNAVAAAQKTIRSLRPQLRRAEAALASARAEVENFRKGPITACEALSAANDDAEIALALKQMEPPPHEPPMERPQVEADEGSTQKSIELADMEVNEAACMAGEVENQKPDQENAKMEEELQQDTDPQEEKKEDAKMEEELQQDTDPQEE